MKLLKRLSVAALLIVAGLSWSVTVYAESGNMVKTMDMAALNRLVDARDSQCLIVAMAAWCAPCREELPTLNKLYSRYHERGLQLFGISLDLEGPSAMQPVVDRMKVNFPVYWVGEEAVEAYAITAMPVIFVVKDGQIVERIIGRRQEKFLDRKIRDFLQ